MMEFYFEFIHIHIQVTTLAGNKKGFADGPAPSASFSSPQGLAADVGGNIFVADYNNNRIRRIDWTTHIVTTVAGNGIVVEQDGVDKDSEFNYPYGLTSGHESIYVVDLYGGTIRKIGTMFF